MRVARRWGAAGRGAPVTASPRPICQWCDQPITGRPVYWNDRPQCRDAIRCERRRCGGQKEPRP